MLVLQIPPYLAALYVGMTTLGLLGAALAFCGRCVADWLLLSLAARAGFRSLPALVGNFGLLALGVYHASASNRDWSWWSITAALLLLTAAIGWLSLPRETRTLLMSKLDLLRRGKAYG